MQTQRLLVACMSLRAIELALQWHSIRARHYIRHKDLVAMGASPWVHLKRVLLQMDHSALQVVGIMWEVFDFLQGYFKPLLEDLWCSRQSAWNVKGSGRKRVMWADDMLGLSLTCMLMLMFALSPATLSDYLKDGWKILQGESL